MIRSTSREAYQSVLPVLNDRQRAVLSLLEGSEPLTNAEIAQRLGWTINRVTPRTLELRTAGCVTDAGARSCRVTGRKAHAWAAQGREAKAPPRMVPTEVMIDGVPHIRFVPDHSHEAATD